MGSRFFCRGLVSFMLDNYNVSVSKSAHSIRDAIRLIIGSGICIAGAAGWTAGRVMQVLQLGGVAAESARLRMFGLVQIVAGIIPVLFAAVRSRE